MKITLESTDVLTRINGQMCRVWRGTTERGIAVTAAGCSPLRPAPFPAFPFQSARVFVERSVLSTGTVWLEAGSPRHVLGLNPSQLIRLTRSETADLVLE